MAEVWVVKTRIARTRIRIGKTRISHNDPLAFETEETPLDALAVPSGAVFVPFREADGSDLPGYFVPGSRPAHSRVHGRFTGRRRLRSRRSPFRFGCWSLALITQRFGAHPAPLSP